MAQRSIRPRPIPRVQRYPRGWPRTMQAALYYNRKNRLERESGDIIVAPEPVSPPTITGTATEGETLSIQSNGIWSGSPTPTFTHQWLRGGIDIPGETGLSYILASADVGELISCRVTGTNSAGSDSSVSNELGPVAAQP